MLRKMYLVSAEQLHKHRQIPPANQLQKHRFLLNPLLRSRNVLRCDAAWRSTPTKSGSKFAERSARTR